MLGNARWRVGKPYFLLWLMLALALVIGAALLAQTLVYGQDSSPEVVASGLDNPRGLGFAPDGSLYVAEAGRGGETCFDAAPPSGDEPGEPEPEAICGGDTGAITRVFPGTPETRVGGLPSIAAQASNGSAATGPHDVSFDDAGQAYFVTGLGAAPGVRQDPDIPADFADGAANLGVLFRSVSAGESDMVADIAGYEATANPDGGELDSNPYGVLTLGDGLLVVDAGANALLSVNSAGDVSTVAVFPTRPVDAPPFIPPDSLPPDGMIPMQAVPTSVALGPDGAYYVSQLTGFPFPAGAARVYRVVPGEEPEIYADGFSSIIDIAFEQDGSLLVLEFYNGSLLDAEAGGDFMGGLLDKGRLVRVKPDGSQQVVLDEGLTAPGGVTVGPDGSIYITNCGVCAGEGEVIRISGDAPAAAMCYGHKVTILGTSDDDVIMGTEGADVIHGLGGNDTINGLGGNDIICAGPGDDRVEAGPGNDIVIGEDGDDWVNGGDGHDLLDGGPGNDTLIGGVGMDILWGEPGDDTLRGDQGTDRLFGGPGNDELRGGEGQDTLSGDVGNDELFGGDGQDVLNGGIADDDLAGGTNQDIINGSVGDDSLEGEGQFDVCNGGADTDSLANCERVSDG